MTSHGIAQRLLTAYGPSTAKAKVQDKLEDIASVEFRAGDRRFLGPRRWREILAKHTARKMLWTAVRNHLSNA